MPDNWCTDGLIQKKNIGIYVSTPYPDKKEIRKHILRDKKIIKQVANGKLKSMESKFSLRLPALLTMDNEISVSPNFSTGKINFCVESYFHLRSARFAVSHDFEYEIQDAKVGPNSKRLELPKGNIRDIRLIDGL